MKILIAEDDAVNILVYRKILGILGHEIEIAHNGEEAFQMAENSKFDLIFMDINMPIMDGIQSSHLIKQHKKNCTTKIFAITAMPAELVLKKTTNGTFEKIITKPISLNALKHITCDFEKIISQNNV